MITIGELAAAMGAAAEGDRDLAVRGPAEPAAAGPDQVAIAMEPRYAEALGQGQARAAVLWDGADWRALGLAAAIYVPRPRYALAALTAAFDRPPALAAGIHATALIDPSARVGEGAAIGPYV
jgi:UDP-3-O-[3-hydroxymyristoyl] glucosamine N-acyltransferase